jgi:hypothetical protein
VTSRSGLLNFVGGLLAVGGLAHLALPQPNYLPPKDTLDYFVSVWLIASGLGLVLHKRWALFLLAGGGLILSVSAFVNTLSASGDIAAAGVTALVLGIVTGVPVFLVWLRRDRLQPVRGETVDA